MQIVLLYNIILKEYIKISDGYIEIWKEEKAMSRLTEWIRDVSWDKGEVCNDFIWNSSIEEIFETILYIRRLIVEDFYIPEVKPYSFVPNDELSGFGGCMEVKCKIRRAKKFATFSALYADYVFVKLKMITNAHMEDWDFSDFREKDIFDFKYSFLGDMLVILQYLTLIEHGVIIIEPPRQTYCKDCFRKVMLGSSKEIDYSAITEFVKKNAEVILLPYKQRDSYVCFEIRNIEDYFDGESLLMVREKSCLSHLRSVKSGKKNNNEILIDSMLEQFVTNQFLDACYYTMECRKDSAKLITSKPSDALFAAITREKESDKAALESFTKLPQYDIPFFSDISLEKAMKLRELEGESFDRYRVALDSAVKEQCKTSSESEWKDIYSDILYPEFTKLDMKLRNIKDGIFSKTFVDIFIITMAITAGVLSGSILETTGGTIVGGAISTAVSTGGVKNILMRPQEKKSELRENDFYFLWRLKNKK